MNTLWKLLLVAAVMVCKTAIAADLGPNHTILITSNLVLAATASTTNAVEASLCTLHTFQTAIATGTTTNTTVNVLDRTLDGANWFPWFTNTASVNGAVAEATCTGTWQQFRIRSVVTNGANTNTIFYQGLR